MNISGGHGDGLSVVHTNSSTASEFVFRVLGPASTSILAS
jgi:hypothetical protein